MIISGLRPDNMKENYFLILLFSFLLIGCSQKAPAHVYVPSADFQESLTISIIAPVEGIKTNEWISLKATRKAGPWIKVEKSKLSNNDCWMINPPTEIEEDVQSNVKWNVEPTGYAAFNIPKSNNIFERKVKFTRQGKYKLWATSHSWCRDRLDSNIIEIHVK